MKESANSRENTHVVWARRLAETQLSAAQTICGDEQEFDVWGAELLMRSPAVLTDRLKLAQFKQLSPRVQTGFKHVAEVSKELKAPSTETLKAYPHETTEEADYRINVWQPMHQLQSVVQNREYGEDLEPVVRESVYLSSQLFHDALIECVENGFPSVIETLRYFEGNISARSIRDAASERL